MRISSKNTLMPRCINAYIKQKYLSTNMRTSIILNSNWYLGVRIRIANSNTFQQTYPRAYFWEQFDGESQSIHVNTHTYIHIYIHTYIHIYVHAYIYTYIRTYMHACIHVKYMSYLHASKIQTQLQTLNGRVKFGQA